MTWAAPCVRSPPSNVDRKVGWASPTTISVETSLLVGDAHSAGNLIEFAPTHKALLMAIYGTALLSFCLVSGLIIGRLLGWAVGVDANVGGVGIAMLLLIGISGKLQQTGHLPKPTQAGILFWSSLYIPIVVAMAASQNVRKAITGGPAAILAGTLVVVVSFALVPILHRLGNSDSTQNASSDGDEPKTRREDA